MQSACAHDPTSPFPRCSRRRGRALVAAAAGVLAPTPAGATPGTAAEAARLVRPGRPGTHRGGRAAAPGRAHRRRAAGAAEAAAAQAAAAHEAVAVYEPQLRAIAQTAHTGRTQSRMAAFLTSESADELVQQITTLDLIAARTNGVVVRRRRGPAGGQEAQAAADEAAALAEAGARAVAGAEGRGREARGRLPGATSTGCPPPSRSASPRPWPAARSRTLGRRAACRPGSAVAVAIAAALAQVGDRYVCRRHGPDAFDCSGLTSFAYAPPGSRCRTPAGRSPQLGRQVSRNELQPGDLVFYYSPISHVALYIGNGMIVHARTYGKPVAVTSVDQSGYRFGVRLTG